MSLIVKLLISSLFSIHQYIPDNEGYKKYFTDVRQASPEDVIPAAHESCRYMISVFVKAGLEVTLGSSGNDALNIALTKALGGDQTLESVLGDLSSELFKDKFEKNNIDIEDLQKNVLNLCSVNFSPLSYSPSQRQEVYDFIQSEISVLSDVHLNSLGDFNYFGSVNIFDRSGEMLGTLDAVPRAWVPYDKMSPRLTLALLATEDEDFFEHRGVDSKAIARIISEVLSGRDATGGSTVTMQLLKNMYFLNGPDSNYEALNRGSFSTLLRKAREWYWAWPFEKEHAKVMGDINSKKYVLEMYFNLVDLGPRIQGIEQAAVSYFNKSSAELDLAESAFITSLLKAPSTFSNPRNYVERTLPRRNDYILTRAGRICENFKSGALSTNKLAIKDTYERICKDGKDSIDFKYIENAKKTPLPEVTRPSSIAVSTSDIHIRNQVSQWVKNHKFDPAKKPKEISIQTTIKEPLQKIIFDIVRQKIDEYDDDRVKKISDIQPANDDTGKKAHFREIDINSSVKSQINSLISKNKNKDNKYFVSIKYANNNETNETSDYTLDFMLITAYLTSKNLSPEEITKLEAQIEKDLKSKSKNVGDIYLIEFNDLDYRVLSIQDYINANKDLSITDAQVFLANFDPIMVRNQIIVNAVQRMDRVKPRDYMRVGVVSENGNLINSNLEVVKLPDDDRKRAQSFRFGDFFWLRPEDLTADIETQNLGSFRLDSVKLQASVIVMDSNTGEVLANFGGYDPLSSGFNRSKDGLRQAGSTLKPWIYLHALNKGFDPQTIIDNNFVSFQIPGKRVPFRPKNYSTSLNGNLAFAQSLIHSQNIGTYNLIKSPIWGPDWRTNLEDLRSFFASIELYDEVDKEVTIMLGSQVISLETLASSFTFFANGSKIAKPQYIKYVTDYKGQKHFELEPSYIQVPLQKPNSVFQIQTLLAEIANSGTAAQMNEFVKKDLSEGKYSQSCFNDVIGSGKQTCFGGKTGTSDEGKDVWFIGFSKNFVIGVWVGYDLPQPIGGSATGGGLALPIFKEIVTQAEAYLPPIEPFITDLMKPADLDRVTVYGFQACAQGNTRPLVIYTDYNSNTNRCNYQSQSQTQPTAVATPTVSNQCNCVRTQNGAQANVFYQGQYVSGVAFYRSVSECEQNKYLIKTRNGVSVCQ